ncbi:hypothetical protein NQ314_015418 [Rhamnusium bicolor]|uniref:Uncharacterized protein n=1 Tax=Rhamnusium bicolor TaxID=1586634 RepID=A0AAV8WYK0_9CUCU|nr:hypothetical protein NQ314_015418 [Rhamnusium bicolor]
MNKVSQHVKTCRNRPQNDTNPGKRCLTKSQTFMAMVTMTNNDFLKSSRIKDEVFTILRPDNISFVAKNDPLICLYGEALLAKHKRQQISTVVSNKIREIARLLIAIRSLGVEAQSLFGSF